MAGIYVEREELLKRKKARVLVRPMLYINGAAIGFKALEEVTLVLNSVDRDGVASSKEVRDFKLQDDAETVYEFQVPENLSDLHVTLKAKIQQLSTGNKIDVSDSAAFALNQIDKTEHFADVHFSRLEKGYVLSILGKTGEPLADRAINIDIKHHDFTEVLHVTLQSGRMAGSIWDRWTNSRGVGSDRRNRWAESDLADRQRVPQPAAFAEREGRRRAARPLYGEAGGTESVGSFAARKARDRIPGGSVQLDQDQRRLF